MSPLVSILMPNYNGAAYLEEAIASGLAQTHRDFELIVVDDGSTDRSMEILDRVASRHGDRVRVVTHDGHVNRGLVESYRLALSHARGSVVAFLECDDTWRPDNLERKAAVLARHSEVGVVHADFRPFGAPRGSFYWSIYGWVSKRQVPTERPYDALGPLLIRNPIPSFTHFVVRRSVLDLVPPFEGMKCNCDWWALAHASAMTRFYFIPEKLTSWRIHSTSSHYGGKKVSIGALREYLFALHDSLLALPALRDRPLDRARIARVRGTIERLEPSLLEAGPAFLASLRRNPSLSMGLLADAVLRRALFS